MTPVSSSELLDSPVLLPCISICPLKPSLLRISLTFHFWGTSCFHYILYTTHTHTYIHTYIHACMHACIHILHQWFSTLLMLKTFKAYSSRYSYVGPYVCGWTCLEVDREAVSQFLKTSEINGFQWCLVSPLRESQPTG